MTIGRYRNNRVSRSHVPSLSMAVPLYIFLSDMTNRTKKRTDRENIKRYKIPIMKQWSSNTAMDLKRGKNSNAIKPIAEE